MSEVTFNEPDYNPTRVGVTHTQQGSFFSRMVIKAGLAQDEAGAQRVMLIGVVVIVVVAIAIYAYGQIASSDGKFIPAYPPAVNNS